MNNTKIEYADKTFNPVTGCLNDCPYCYARKIANRFGSHIKPTVTNNTAEVMDLPCVTMPDPKHDYKELPMPYPYDFKPTFHKYRLDEPQKIKKPQNIFVCSMADLFGDWVPDEWIKEVFKACEAAPQHNYLFLTKNGSRYEQLGLCPNNNNFWYGTTRTGTNTEHESGASDNDNTFLSIEPLLAPIDKETLSAIELWNWIIIGAETGNRKGKVVPKAEWIAEIVFACDEAGVPVFMKDSSISVVGEENMRREFPEGLKK